MRLGTWWMLSCVLTLACEGRAPSAQRATPIEAGETSSGDGGSGGAPAAEGGVDSGSSRRLEASARSKLRRFESAAELDSYLSETSSRVASQAFGTIGLGGLGLIGTGMGGGGVGQGYGAGGLSDLSSGSGKSGEGSITNNQEAGVDEGGIVKQHGEHLVVLRRGRLFTVQLGDDELAPRSMMDVGPRKRHQAWYDEMLVHEDRVIVIGYSYQLRATELAVFTIDAQGELGFEARHYLRSNDYYSSRNYASRLVGDQVVFYMPAQLSAGWVDGKEIGPAQCVGREGGCEEWKGLLEATDIYYPASGGGQTLHAVISCELGEQMSCHGRGILGPWGRNFYVSAQAVYVWVADPSGGQPPPWKEQPQGMPTNSLLYRLGLQEHQVSVLRTYGTPIDQFSFHESDDGHLNVLVADHAWGGAMWGSEYSAAGELGLYRVPLRAFENEVCDEATRAHMFDLPEPSGGTVLHNRFIDGRLLYGLGAGWGPVNQKGAELLVVDPAALPFAPAPAPQRVRLEHGVDRIEPMGGRGVVVGTRGADLHVSAIAFGSSESPAATHVEPHAAQGELRSHGFFYRPLSETRGWIGLPTRGARAPGSRHLRERSAEVLYLSADADTFTRLGSLEASAKRRRDRCHTSCVDWYGNSRPLFVGGRIFALLGYEIVEGELRGDQLRELRRANLLDADRPDG